MRVETWISPDNGQMCRIGDYSWSIARLIWLSRDFEVMEIPLKHLNIYSKYENLSLREMVMHMEAVNNADLDYPIILDEDGEILDGRHRIMKAMLNKCESIKAVRFEKNPPACRVDN